MTLVVGPGRPAAGPARGPARARRRARAPIAAVLLAVVGTAGVLLGLPAATVVAQGTITLRVDPPTLNVNGGETITFNIVQDAAVATTGVQTDLVFDKGLVEILDIEPGAPYAGGLFLYGSIDDGTSASVEAAIAKSNETGVVKNLATFLLPGSGAVPPGEAVFLTVTLKARYGEGGTNPLSLQRPTVLDENSGELKVQTEDGTVTVGAAVAPSGVATPSAAPTASGSPGDASSAPLPGATVPPADVAVAPTSLEITAGSPARIFLVARTGVPASSIVADLAFDREVLEITGLEPGPAWNQASVIAGGSGQSLEQAVAEANASGVLKQAGVFLLSNTSDPPSGETVFLAVLVVGRVDGTSSLAVTGGTVLDTQGASIPLNEPGAEPGSTPGATGRAGAAGGTEGQVDPLLMVGVILLVLVASGAVVIRSGVIPERRLRRWPYVVSLLLALVPVVLFAGMLGMLVVSSAPVLESPGLASILGATFSSKRSVSGALGDYGLMPAVWGTIEITIIAVVVALPVSLAMAVVSAEFPMGPLGKVLRPLLGVLAGVPPIVYAISALVFVTVFMAPKFAGSDDYSSFDPMKLGVPSESWPPPDVPWSAFAFAWPQNTGGIPNSTLLGGILIALLVIPFMAPLIFDAMRNVPSVTREASFALGANRGYTLRRVILPQAMPGIVAALALATLKALGDVLIVALAVGWQAETIPNPIGDVLERTSSLAAEGAGLLGDLGGSSCGPANATACSVGYSAGLLLLLFAAAIVVVATILEGRLRRRLRT